MSTKTTWKVGDAYWYVPPMEQDGEDGMSPGFAVFNLHVNNAGNRADHEFKRIFGEKCFKRVIAPLHEEGIMSIFDTKPTMHRMAWVAMVTGFVNERQPS